MADKAKKLDEKNIDAKKSAKGGQTDKPVKRGRRWLKWLLILLLLLLLAGVGFAAGIYLKLFDVQTMAERWGMAEYPVVGKYLVQPKTNFETVPLDSEPVTSNSQVLPAMPADAVNPLLQPPVENKKLDASELQRLEKMKQQEQAKTIGKLARLYGGMKPDEVVPIINLLDDTTVIAIFNKMEEDQVSKIMATMDAKRAAALTQIMMKGKLATTPESAAKAN